MSEVLTKVREKFSQYKDVPDEELAFRIGSKYPAYLDSDSKFKEEFQTAAVGMAQTQALSQVGSLLGVLTDPAAGEAAQSGRETNAFQSAVQPATPPASGEERAARDFEMSRGTEFDPLKQDTGPKLQPQSLFDSTLSKLQNLPVIGKAFTATQLPYEIEAQRSGIKEKTNVANAVRDLLAGGIKPESLALLATGAGEAQIAKLSPEIASAVKGLVSSYFAWQGVKGVGESLPEAFKPGKTFSERLGHLTAAAGSGTIAVLAGAHALSTAAEAAKPVAPMTAAAVQKQAEGVRFLQEGTEDVSTREFLPKTPQDAPEAKSAVSTLPKPQTPQVPPKAAEPDTETAPVEDLQTQLDAERSEEPVTRDRITAASYTNPETGKTTTGSNHIEAAKAQGVDAPENPSDRHGESFGFEVWNPNTKETRYVSRDQAEEIARENGQLLEEPKRGALHSDEIEFFKKKGSKNASEVSKTTEVHGDVLSQPEGGVRTLPTEEGGTGVHPQTEGRVSEAQKSEPSTEQTVSPAQSSDAPPEQSAPAGGTTETVPPSTGKRKVVAASLSNLSNTRRFHSETALTGPDILSWMHENMKMLSKSAAKRLWAKEKYEANKSLWDDSAPLQRPHHNQVYSDKGSTPDVVAQAAYVAGLLKEPSVNELHAEMQKASKTRSKAFTKSRQETALLKEESKQHEEWLKATKEGEERVSAEQLKTGDSLEVDGEHVRVTKMDADGNVTLEDGRRFGTQVLSEGQSIHVEKFDAAPKGEAEFLPETEQEKPAEPKPATPKLGAIEKGTGDLLKGVEEDFSLTGEKGTDADRIAAEKSKAEQTAKEAKELGAKQQQELPTAKPEVKPAEAAKPQKYRLKNAGPQTYSVIERLKATPIEIENGEQPVRVKNDHTGAEAVVLENQLQAVKERSAAEREKSKPMSKKELDDELRRIGLDPSSFKTSIEKRMALKRAKAKAGGEAGFIINIPQEVIDFARDVYDKVKDFTSWAAHMARRFGTMSTDAIRNIWDHLTGATPPAATPATAPSVIDKAKIDELHESLTSLEGKKISLEEKVKQSFDLGEKLAAGKDAVSRAIAGLKASGDYIIRKWEGYDTLDDLLRAKGELSGELETRGFRVRRFAKTVMKQFPDKKQRAAIAKWVDAGGDQNELHWGSMQTQAQYRQAYVDAMSLEGDALAAAQSIRNYFEERLQEAIDAGVLEHGVENFIHRVYERDPKAAQQLASYAQSGILSRNPGLAKRRIFQLDWEAERLGYRPVQDFLKRITDYETSLSKAIAARKFVQKVVGFKDASGNKVRGLLAPDGRPIVDVAGMGTPVEDASGVREATLINPSFKPGDDKNPLNNRSDYKERPEFSALRKWRWATTDAAGKPIYVQGNVVVHPQYAERIDALLKPSSLRFTENPVKRGVFRTAIGVSSTVKQTMLDLSGFHQVQIAVHALEHRVNPLTLEKDIDFTDPNVDGLMKGGVTLGGEYREAHSGEGLIGRSVSRLIPGVSTLMETYHNYLFQDFIPRIKMTMALHALERNKGRFASEISSGRMKMDEVYKLTADQSNAAFGMLNYTTLERSKTAQDISRIVLLAPDFLEARGRFALQAFTKHGKEQRQALLLGAITMYTVARIANQLIDGQPHMEPENAFSIIYKKKAYSLRTVQGDILHLIEKPVQFWMSRLNPVYGRTLLELATGRDYFGRKRSGLEQIWDGVSTMVPVSLRSSQERKLWESMLNGMGVTARRYSDTDEAFKMAQKWKDAHGMGGKGEFIYDSNKDPLRPLKLALSNGDDADSVKEIKKLVDSKKMTTGKLGEYFNRYSSMPFTGSHDNDRKFIKTLNEDQRKTVEAARQHKREIRSLFQKARDKYVSAAHSKPEAPSDAPDEAVPAGVDSDMQSEMKKIP